MTGDWVPSPISTAGVELPPDVLAIAELLAENGHDNWAHKRLNEGWRYGETRDDAARTHPDLVPYAELPESEKAYDRTFVLETLKVLHALGFRLCRSQP
jgi:RyR domain